MVIACGVWSPKIGRMAGATIPLTPAIHQMIDIGPVPRFAGAKKGIEWPIVRDMDTNMYERQDGTGLEIGSYAHRPILHDPEEIPSIEESALSPTEFPFTEDDFALQMEQALELMPEIVGDESVGIKYAINGLLSLTPDGLPLLGETPEVRGLWSAAAVWVKEGPGVGKAVAEWMTHGESEIDLQSSDIARFYPCQKTRENVRARAAEGFNKTYGIVHPGEQWGSGRGVRLPPFHDREEALGAMFFETAGWERPFWYESNAPLVEQYGLNGREAEWDARWWSPIINAEHLAMRERAAMFDLSAFAIFDIAGDGALDTVQRVAMRQMDVPVGRAVYTPLLTPGGGFRSDLTILRLADDRFRVVTGGLHGMADLKWCRDHADGAVVTDLTGAWTTLGLWGPRARDILSSITRDDVSHESFPFARCRFIEVGTAAGARAADLLRRRPRLGAARPDRAGRHDVGHGLGGRAAARSRPGRDRRLRHDGPDREGLPRLRLRARRRVRRGRGRHGLGQGQGPGLRRPRGAPAPPRERAGGADVHADRRRPHVGVRREALHARPRADRHPRRRPAGGRQGPALVRDHGWVCSLDRQVRADGVPAARARARGRGAGRRVHERALSRYRRGGRLDADLRPGEHPHPLLMDILVCVKRVPLTGGKMVLTADERAIETRHLGFTISPHEECGVEEAVRIVEAGGGSVTVVTLGPPEAEEQLRECLALGADRAILLETDGSDWDPEATAEALLEVVAGESPDLVIFGNESADSGGYQVGIRIAHALGRPVVTGLKALAVEDGQVRGQQETGDVYRVPLPAVVTVKEGINLPRYPSVPAKLRARKKPVDRRTPGPRAPRLELVRLVVPEGRGKQAEVLGEGPAAAPAVVELFQRLGIA